MRTAKLWRGMLAFVAAKLNAQIAIECSCNNLAADPVKIFSLGWQDPFRLQAYNALMVIPDRLRPSRNEILVKAPIAFIAGIKSSSASALTDAMAIYADAIANIFEADPSAGGVAIEVIVDDVDFSLPSPGSPCIGALTVLATVSIDQI